MLHFGNSLVFLSNPNLHFLQNMTRSASLAFQKRRCAPCSAGVARYETPKLLKKSRYAKGITTFYKNLSKGYVVDNFIQT